MTYTFLQYFALQRILLPQGLLGWIGWLGAFFVAALIALRYSQARVWTRREWLQLLAVVIAVPVVVFIFTLRLPADGALPIPDLGTPAFGPILAPLVALPWLATLLIFGARPAVGLAAFTGLLMASWDTRSAFSVAEHALIAALFIFLINQRYRTTVFAWLRRPFVAALALSLAYPFLYIATSFLWVSANPLVSLDFALSRVVWATAAFAAPLLVAGLVLQALRLRWPALVPALEAAQPSPGERSLEGRLLFSLAPVVLLAFVALGALTWWNAGQSAEQLLSDRISNNLEIAADSVPFLLETGQNLVLQLADDARLADPSPDQAASILQSHLSGVPYFEQLTLLDTGGNNIVGVPLNDYQALSPVQDELNAVSLAIQGVALQIVSVPSSSNSESAQLLFIVAIRNSNDQVRSVLVARTTLATNPFAQPVTQSLQSIDALGAQGLLIDANGRIVMAPVAAAILQPYNGEVSTTPASFDGVSADGSRLVVRYQPVPGSNWAAAARWPAQLSQQLALDLALPIFGVLFLLALAAYALMRVSLRSVTRSLQDLATETQRIAAGDLKAPLSVKGADEVGQLGSAFESMRRAVLNRTEETQRLLALSQGLSSSLEVRSHIDPILAAALASGATVARLVFSSENGGSAVGFGKGEGNEKYESLDPQVIALTRAQERVLLSNPARARLKVDRGTLLPESVAAFALMDRHEHLGALWLAYDQPQTFAADSVRYLETLASQAAAAATNARLYVTARLSQQRLEGVLMADAQAILLMDSKQNLVFANIEAARILNLKAELPLPQPVQAAIANKAVLALLRAVTSKPQAAEIEIDKALYNTLVTPIWAGPELIGFSCTLQDVTRAKAVESARLEFLGTVGHDLQDPLELIRGYLSMLSMMGELNDQQNSYVQKIERSVESISRLAASLLATERLDGGEGGLQLESFALKDLLASVIDEIAPRARQKKVQLITEQAEGSEKLLVADRTLLRSALYNLLDNAVKFSPRAGKVLLSATYAADKVTLAIKDSGGGIAPVDLPRLFDRPAGLQKAATGLAIVRSIVERHKGKAWAESELGAGSTFYLQIPVQQPKSPR